MILVIGEILVDVFREGPTLSVLPGGAPFNVACNIAHFGGDVGFLGAVGADEYGDFLVDFAGRKNIRQLIIGRRSGRQTTQAFVELTVGERNFTFKRDNAADYDLRAEDLSSFSFDEYTTIHLGSLLLSEEEGRIFVGKLFELIDKYGFRLSFDVNYREDIFGPMEGCRYLFAPVITKADIVKFSEEEVLLYTGESDVERAVKSFGISSKLIIVTLGNRGSMYYLDGIISRLPNIKVTPVDSTGAGDAFLSYVLFSLDRQNLSSLKKSELDGIFLRANIIGALATLKKGAIDVVPTLEEINGYPTYE